MGHNETDVANAKDHDNHWDDTSLSPRLNLKLSSVTMTTHSILDRYRSNTKTNTNNVKHYIRGTCPSTAFWDKLSPHTRDKSDSLKYEF